MTLRKKVTIGIFIVLIIIAALLLFMLYSGYRPGTGGNDEIIYVQKVSDFTQTQVSVDRFAGIVESQKAQQYKKDPERSLETVYVKEGDTVTVGTPLFKYDVRPSENSIASIKLDIESLSNEIAYLNTQGSDAETQLAISERELEIKQKKADMARYQQEIDQAEVLADIGGIVKSVNEKGEDGNNNPVPVVTITEIGEFRVKGKVSEQTIGTVTSGMSVIIRSRVDETKTWNGSISKIDTEPAQAAEQDQYSYGYGEGGERSTSYPFYVSLESTKGLMLGQHVFIEPDYGQSSAKEKEGIWLDQSFIVYEGESDSEAYVWVGTRGRLSKEKVTLGEVDEEDFTVQILSGLSEDDKIAWPDETFREGMKVVDVAEAD